MKQLLIIVISLTVVFAGCQRHKPLADAIIRADAVVCVNPDSALAILAAADTAGAPERLKAHYVLIATKARDKAYVRQPGNTDSLINIAYNYFRGNKDTLELQSLFYRGVVLHNKGEYTSALLSLMDAADMAESIGDLFYEAMSLREQATIIYGSYMRNIILRP